MALAEDDPLLLEAIEIFDKGGYSYKLKLSGSMMWVKSKVGERYAFYPTTGRWAPFGNRNKHYRSKGAQDFVDRFLKPNDDTAEAMKRLRDKEIQSLFSSLLNSDDEIDLQELTRVLYDLGARA